MKKIIAWVLTLTLLLSLAACGQETPETTTDTQSVTTQPPEATTEAYVEETMPDETAEYISISYSDEEGNYYALTAFDDGEGHASLDYQGQLRKVTTMELSALEEITAKIGQSGLLALNGQNIFEEGMASASVYVMFPSGYYLSAGFSGVVPQEFLDSYAFLDDYFLTLLADVPEYVPRPIVTEGVDENHLQQLEAILDASGMEPLDMFAISNVPKDEYFAMNMGLSADTGIAVATSCMPMMSATAYSCVLATLEEGADAKAITADFLDDVEWNKWVCVAATHALVAQKDGMLLCLIGSEEMYQMTAAALEATDWTVLETATAY